MRRRFLGIILLLLARRQESDSWSHAQQSLQSCLIPCANGILDLRIETRRSQCKLELTPCSAAQPRILTDLIKKSDDV